MPTFAQLLVTYTRRTGVSDAELARAAGVRRQTVFRWKEGLVGRPRRRDEVLRCAEKLRLTAEERDALLLAAGFAPQSLQAVVYSNVAATAHPVALDPEPALPQRDAQGDPAAPVAAAVAVIPRRGARPLRRVPRSILAVAAALLFAIVVAGLVLVLPARADHRVYPRASPGETLIVVGTLAAPTSAEGARSFAAPSLQEDLQAAITREAQAARLTAVRVASWPDALPDDTSANAALMRSGAAIVVGGAEAGATAKLSLVTQSLGGRVDDLPLEALAAVPSDSSLPVNAVNADEIQAVALLVLSRVYIRRGDHALARSAVTQAGSRSGLSDDFRSALALDQGYLALTARPPDLPGALAAFDQALASSDSAEARLDRGLAYLRMGDATRWRPDLDRAAALAATDSQPESARCWGYVLDRQPADALAQCDAANRLHAPPSEWQEPRAIADAELGRYDRATSDLRDFRTWLDQQPAELRARYGSRAEDWLRALAAGRDPFDESTLDSLRRE